MIWPPEVPHHTHEEDERITEMLAEALGERRTRLTDRRLVIIFVVAVIIAGIAGTYLRNTRESLHETSAALDKFKHAIAANCEANRLNTVAFNDFIGKLQATTANAELLSYSDRVDRVNFYQTGKQPVPVCPPVDGTPVRPKTTEPPPPPVVPRAPR